MRIWRSTKKSKIREENDLWDKRDIEVRLSEYEWSNLLNILIHISKSGSMYNTGDWVYMVVNEIEKGATLAGINAAQFEANPIYEDLDHTKIFVIKDHCSCCLTQITAREDPTFEMPY